MPTVQEAAAAIKARKLKNASAGDKNPGPAVRKTAPSKKKAQASSFAPRPDKKKFHHGTPFKQSALARMAEGQNTDSNN